MSERRWSFTGVIEMVGARRAAMKGRPRDAIERAARRAQDDAVEGLASRLAEDARVRAYEILGERERAVSIMERRLRS